MKKKFTIHLDALLVITILFITAIGVNILQAKQVSQLGSQAVDLRFELLQKQAMIEYQQQKINELTLKQEAIK